MKHLHRSRGYTIVELMMAVTIFGIGVSGIAAMQIVSAAGNGHAKDLAIATSLARSWQERLAMDASVWGGELSWNVNQTTWLSQQQPNDNTWFQPGFDSLVNPTFGPAAGPLGEFVNHTLNPEGVVFCTHIRLTALVDRPGSELIRTEVRVFWPKGESHWSSNNGDYCDGTSVVTIGASSMNTTLADKFHFVYKTTAVRAVPEF